MFVCVRSAPHQGFIQKAAKPFSTNVVLFSMKYSYPPVIVKVIDILPFALLVFALSVVYSVKLFLICSICALSKYYGGGALCSVRQ